MRTKSGKYWVTWAEIHAENSKKLEDLASSFRARVEEFVKALRDAGATVTIRATRRSAKRAYLFHWSWKIGLGKCKPAEASRMTGVDIVWDHGNDAASRAGAKEMIDGFGLAVPPASTNAPALRSKHISGTAVDMDITWRGDLKVKKKGGAVVVVPFLADPNLNLKLQEVGASYGVKKLTTDAPHWSDDGH